MPEPKLYQGLAYQPPPATELTRRQGGIVGDFIRAAQRRHLKVHLQVQAAIPPGYRVQFGGPRDDDQPRLPDGRIPPRRLARNGSLASPAIVGYLQALIRDLCRAYPDIDGLRLDWPEYPPYFLDDAFLDFGAHAAAAARRLDFDFAVMQRAAQALYQTLHGRLSDAAVQPWLEGDGGRFALLAALQRSPALLDWLRFKARLVAELLRQARATLTAAAGRHVELLAHAFPPPFSVISGMDFATSGQHCQGFCVKLYTLHWPMIVRFWGDVLHKANPNLSERVLVRALVKWLDIADDEGLPRLQDYHYPEPNEAQPVGLEAQARKLRQARAEAGATPVYALAHGYGRLDEFRRRLQVAWQASGGRVWINRYGYLSDEKLKIIAEVCRAR
jgi:hypothetical protein